MATAEPSGSSRDTMQAGLDFRFGSYLPSAENSRAAAALGHPGDSGVRSIPCSRQDLVDALRLTGRGDQAAFRIVYAATSVKLFGVILRILGRRSLAEDVLQEVYIRVWQRAGDFDPAISSPITWLVSIARNRALDEGQRKTMRSLDDYSSLLKLPKEDNPHADHESAEERRRVQACLDALEPEKSEIVRLAYYYGMTGEEIAVRINRPVGIVKTWLRRSLTQLKNCLDQ